MVTKNEAYELVEVTHLDDAQTRELPEALLHRLLQPRRRFCWKLMGSWTIYRVFYPWVVAETSTRHCEKGKSLLEHMVEVQLVYRLKLQSF